MFPGFTFSDSTDITFSNIIFSTNSLKSITFFSKLSNLTDIIISQFSHTMLNAKIRLKSILTYLILVVISYTTQKPVFRILTGWIITGMTNKHTFRNFTDKMSITPSSSFIVLFTIPKISIPISISACPKPTLIFISFINFSPVSFFTSRKWLKTAMSIDSIVMFTAQFTSNYIRCTVRFITDISHTSIIQEGHIQWQL